MFICLFFILFWACKTDNNKATTQEAADTSEETMPPGTIPIVDQTLEGTWQLMTGNLAHVGEGESTDFDEETKIIALKIFTRNRFVALRFSEEDHKFLGAGGGTYIQLGNEFREYIEFHTWDSTLANTAQSFKCVFEGDLLTQSGHIEGGTNPGEHLEEVYQRIEPGASMLKEQHPITGSWKLEKMARGDVSGPETLPENENIFKILTPEHYLVVWYRNTGGLIGLSYGTYVITPDYYIETVDCYSYDPSAAGKKYTFNWDIDGNTFVQKGFIDSDLYMDYKIEEYYSRE
jgi:hypothetical protein